jgi:hypothetical protein
MTVESQNAFRDRGRRRQRLSQSVHAESSACTSRLHLLPATRCARAAQPHHQVSNAKKALRVRFWVEFGLWTNLSHGSKPWNAPSDAGRRQHSFSRPSLFRFSAEQGSWQYSMPTQCERRRKPGWKRFAHMTWHASKKYDWRRHGRLSRRINHESVFSEKQIRHSTASLSVRSPRRLGIRWPRGRRQGREGH